MHCPFLAFVYGGRPRVRARNHPDDRALDHVRACRTRAQARTGPITQFGGVASSASSAPSLQSKQQPLGGRKTADPGGSTAPWWATPREYLFSRHRWISRSISRCSFSSAFAILLRSRTSAHSPPLSPLRDALAFPSAVRGPVDCAHGFHRWIASRCRCRCSSVHCRAAMMVCL